MATTDDTTKYAIIALGGKQYVVREGERLLVDREYDQVLRMWMPYDNGFMVFQPYVRNAAAGALRRTDGYGSPAIARLWIDK